MAIMTQEKQTPAGADSHKQWVYLFQELDQIEKDRQTKDWEDIRALLGGKGANLAEMTRLELPVPPGFTVTTEACNAYLAHDHQFLPVCGNRKFPP